MRRARTTALAFFLGCVAISPVVRAGTPTLECPATCDARCEVCCKQWTLSAQCSDGRASPRGEKYATFAAARAAAAAESAGTCEDGQPAVIAPVCVAGTREASPDDEPARAPLIAALSGLSVADANLNAAESSLRSFTSARILSTKGATGGQPLFERIKNAKKSLLRATVETRKAQREAVAVEVSRIVQQVQEATSAADRVSSEVRAFVEDTVNVDVAAEAKERARVEAAQAEQRRKAQAQEEARARAAAEQARREEAARKREEAAAAKRAEAERRKAEAERLAEAKRVAALRLTEEAAAKQRAEAEAKERARQEAALAAQQAEAARQAELAKKAAASEASLRGKLEKDFAEADSRLRSDLDQCSQTIATLTMVEMSSRGQTKVSDAKVSLQNHKDKLRALLGKISALKAKIPLKTAVEEMAQANEEAKLLSKETARLISAAKSLKT